MSILPAPPRRCAISLVSEATAFDQLCRLLRGEHVAAPVWEGIIELANRNLVTPRLESCLDDVAAPDDVRQFVHEVSRRNRQRNARLFEQMGVAAQALNAVGLTPLVIKGGAALARGAGQCLRVINDLDLVVPPDRIDEALSALNAAGFAALGRSSAVMTHSVADLARPDDVGPIDLHQRPPGPAGLVSDPALLTTGGLWPVGPGQVRAPSAELHIYFQALHDQLHDGVYWRGGFDLGHVWELADLIADERVDWDRLAALPPTRLMRHAVEAQLMACRRLTGAAIPGFAAGWRSRLQADRQRLQHRVPILTAPLAAVAMLSEATNLIDHRAKDRLARARASLPPRSGKLGDGLARLHRVLTTD